MHIDLEKRYFDWLVSTVSKHGNYNGKNYRKLFAYLNTRSFFYILPMDGNRSEDGIDLRYSGFAWQCGVQQHEIERYLDRQDCSVLEMMVCLAIRAEAIVGDPEVGDRTSKWFWDMIESLGLMEMDDIHYNEDRVSYIVDCFLNRDYKPNGKGGLFTLKDPPHDLRAAEIWNQMCWYLSENA